MLRTSGVAVLNPDADDDAPTVAAGVLNGKGVGDVEGVVTIALGVRPATDAGLLLCEVVVELGVLDVEPVGGVVACASAAAGSSSATTVRTVFMKPAPKQGSVGVTTV